MNPLGKGLYLRRNVSDDGLRAASRAGVVWAAAHLSRVDDIRRVRAAGINHIYIYVGAEDETSPARMPDTAVLLASAGIRHGAAGVIYDLETGWGNATAEQIADLVRVAGITRARGLAIGLTAVPAAINRRVHTALRSFISWWSPQLYEQPGGTDERAWIARWASLGTVIPSIRAWGDGVQPQLASMPSTRAAIGWTSERSDGRTMSPDDLAAWAKYSPAWYAPAWIARSALAVGIEPWMLALIPIIIGILVSLKGAA